MRKKTLFLVLLFGLSVFPLASSAYVFLGTVTISDLFANVLDFVWMLFAGLAVILFIAAGLLFLMAQGKPEGVERAKAAVIWGTVGVIVAIVAFSIVTIMQTALGV